MHFSHRHSKHHKSPSAAQAPNQPTYLSAAAIPVTSLNTASEFEYVVIDDVT